MADKAKGRARELFSLAELYEDQRLLRKLEGVAQELESSLAELRRVIQEEKNRVGRP